MIITELRIAGFRGIRDPQVLNFADGFTVLTGRNGSGKSTICDAIEYAMLGSIRPTAPHKEKGESIADYLWWRGDSRSMEQSVTLTLMDSTRGKVTLTRTPNSFRIDGVATVEDALCSLKHTANDAITRLCRTSIIRDEEITQLSVDLPETERFDFVRQAIGTHDFAPIESKVRLTQKLLDEQHTQQQSRYDLIRQKVADVTTRLSIARSDAARVDDVREAELLIRSTLQIEGSSVLELLISTQRRVAENRNRLDSLVRAVRRLEEFDQRRAALATKEYLKETDDARATTQALTSELEERERSLKAAEAALEVQRQELPQITALAELYAVGQRVGLQGNKCPLCNSVVSDFQKHVGDALLKVESSSSSIHQITGIVSAQREEIAVLKEKLYSARRNQLELEQRAKDLEQSIKSLTGELQSLGIPIGESVTTLNLAAFIEDLRAQTSALGAALATLETSRARARVTELENELAQAKADAQEIEKTLESLRDAVRRAKDASSTVKRIQGEFIEERLAELSPLISELYARLRPHADWRKIHYKLRGDVRRMLSFQVGDGLNPSFVFSSGQRRAAGLAFLLAVHLSRRWCLLNTLIMDDPVQHIDDFRALNLAEVLGAIRQNGRQVICAVEDQALGDLLCRRLRSSVSAAGSLVNMAYDSARGVHVESQRQIRTVGKQVLVSA